MKTQTEFDAAIKGVMELSDNLYGAVEFVQKGKLDGKPKTEIIFNIAVLIRDLSQIQSSMVHIVLHDERMAELETRLESERDGKA